MGIWREGFQKKMVTKSVRVHVHGNMKGRVSENMVTKSVRVRVHGNMKGKVSENMFTKSVRVHLHGNMKGRVSENVVTKSVRVHLHGNMKGRVFEKVVSKEGVSENMVTKSVRVRLHGNMKGRVSEGSQRVLGFFTWEYEGKGFWKSGPKEGWSTGSSVFAFVLLLATPWIHDGQSIEEQEHLGWGVVLCCQVLLCWPIWQGKKGFGGWVGGDS